MSKTKRNSLLLLSAAGILVLILAMSLPNLVLSPGQPFSLESFRAEDPETGGALPGGGLEWVFRGIMGLALILLPVYIIYSLLTPEGRQRLIADIVLIAILFFIVYYIDSHPLGESERQREPDTSNSTETGEVSVSAPTARFPADPPSWLPLAVILVMSALVVVFVFAVIRFFQRRARMSGLLMEKLAETAQSTIESLQAGEDFGAIVIRCYREMSRVISEQRGITRETAMTPREFEARLVESGLPREAIATLTRLFEQVRYGRIPSGDREERLALACLTDIVTACRTIGFRHGDS